MRFASRFVLLAWVCTAWPVFAADNPLVVELWPGTVPDEIGNIGETSCRPDFAVLCYSGYLKAKDKGELAPGLSIPAGTPPIFLAHGGDDIISEPGHSVVTYLALKRAGVPAELHIYATAAHDFGVRVSDHPCSTWTLACANWLGLTLESA